MGWSYYVIHGRECGYSVEAECDERGCSATIDRGLSYLCGTLPGGDEYACGKYFCPEHLLLAAGPHQQCRRCYDAWAVDHPEEDLA